MKRKKQTRQKLGVMLLALTVLLAVTRCNKDETSGLVPKPDEGTLNVELTDAPLNLDLVEEASVTISKVEIRKDVDGEMADTGNPFITLYDSTRTFNLLELRNGVTETLANMEVPTGKYDHIRTRRTFGQAFIIQPDNH